ncbi:hypothetical protein DFH09DRAFT_1303094 [Mycena vulgaris]|nr:hypothetical protein DFH09DRAFT_1303094 [Mycena vulgaris]
MATHDNGALRESSGAGRPSLPSGPNDDGFWALVDAVVAETNRRKSTIQRCASSLRSALSPVMGVAASAFPAANQHFSASASALPTAYSRGKEAGGAQWKDMPAAPPSRSS